MIVDVVVLSARTASGLALTVEAEALTAPATVVMFALAPVRLVLSVAVTVWTVPATVLVVKDTVAIPLLFVVLVGEANDPPVPVLVHVTTLPKVGTEVPLASANCAVIVTAVPAAGVLLVDVTMYFVAVP